MTDQTEKPMRIVGLYTENVLRVTVARITPEGNVVQITGANENGKTSVLDSIWMALGGKDAMPEEPLRRGAKSGVIQVTIGDADGPKMIVERRLVPGGKDKQPAITVKGVDGAKYPSAQTMLSTLMGTIGFDPLAFMRMKEEDQFKLLRRLVKFDVDLDALDRRRATYYETRTNVNRDLKGAQVRAAAIVVPDLPDEEPDVSALTDQLAQAADHNQAVARAQQLRTDARQEIEQSEAELEQLLQQVERHKSALAAARRELEDTEKEVIAAPIDTAKVRADIDAANLLADGFRKQTAKIAADGEVTTLERRAGELTSDIDGIDKQKNDALGRAKFPIEGLSFTDGAVTFDGFPLSQVNAAKRLLISASIGAALNPKLRVLLARDGSLLDSKSLATLSAFAEEQDMQIWLERVDESGAVGIVMEDGHVKGQEALVDEMEKRQAGEPAAVEGAPTAPITAPTSEAEERARKYLDAMLKQLATRDELGLVDGDNAAVKAKMKNFPALIAQEWNPEYLKRVQALSRKK